MAVGIVSIGPQGFDQLDRRQLCLRHFVSTGFVWFDGFLLLICLVIFNCFL